jgi:hypothetical protein
LFFGLAESHLCPDFVVRSDEGQFKLKRYRRVKRLNVVTAQTQINYHVDRGSIKELDCLAAPAVPMTIQEQLKALFF